MMRVALNTAAALGVLVGLIVAWQLRDAILIFGLSLALAAALRPPIEYLVRRRFPISLAVACTYLPVLIVLAIALLVPAAWLGFEFKQFADDAMRAYEQIDGWHNGNWFQREVVRILPPPEQAMEILSGDRGIEILATVAGATFGAATVAFYALLVIVLSVYWSLDRVRLERLWLSLLSAILRGRTRQIWHSLESQVGSYLRSEFLQSLLAGLLLGVGYRLIGQPYPVLLALIGAVAWLVPWVGRCSRWRRWSSRRCRRSCSTCELELDARARERDDLHVPDFAVVGTGCRAALIQSAALQHGFDRDFGHRTGDGLGRVRIVARAAGGRRLAGAGGPFVSRRVGTARRTGGPDFA